MAIGNLELMHECLQKHSRMETARMEKKIKNESVSMERRKAGTKEKVPRKLQLGPTVPSGSQRPEAEDELPNYNSSTTL